MLEFLAVLATGDVLVKTMDDRRQQVALDVIAEKISNVLTGNFSSFEDHKMEFGWFFHTITA